MGTASQVLPNENIRAEYNLQDVSWTESVEVNRNFKWSWKDISRVVLTVEMHKDGPTGSTLGLS
jgi:hypothetical protein